MYWPEAEESLFSRITTLTRKALSGPNRMSAFMLNRGCVNFVCYRGSI
jgi:hypothetical protein